MAQILKFDPATGDVLEIFESGFTPDFDEKNANFKSGGNPKALNHLINPVLPDKDLRLIKIVNRVPVLRSKAETDVIAATDAAKVAVEVAKASDAEDAQVFLKSLLGVDLKPEQIAPAVQALITARFL